MNHVVVYNLLMLHMREQLLSQVPLSTVGQIILKQPFHPKNTLVSYHYCSLRSN